MRSIESPPALVNSPPVYTLLPLIAIAFSVLPFMPLPRADQLLVVVSHLAMRLAGAPPAVVKPPLKYTELPLIAIAYTELLVPSSRADQLLVEVSHLAM